MSGAAQLAHKTLLRQDRGMEIKVIQRDDGISHVVLHGRLDTLSVEELEDEFAEVTVARGQATIVDLSHTSFIASRGIGMLFMCSKRLARQGHPFVLVHPQELVAAVLATSRVERVMPIADNIEDALQVVRAGVRDKEASPQSSATQDSAAANDPKPQPDTTAKRLQLTVKNDLSELGRVNESLHRFLDEHQILPRAAYAIDLAIEELLVNIIRYAFVDDDEHDVELDLAVDDERLLLTIEDDGRPFDPREGPEFNPHAEDREVGGLGLVLVLDLVDGLKYERVGNRNRVEVRVRF